MRERLLNLPGYLHERRWLVFVLGVIVEAAFLGPLLAIHSTRYILGIPGSLVALVAVIAGALAGSLVGILVALAGGAVFFASVARFGALSSIPTSLISTGIWCLAALVAGLTADTLRRQSRERERVSRALAQAQSAHETAERILRVAPALHASRDPTELAAQVCRSAQETFGVRLWGSSRSRASSCASRL